MDQIDSNETETARWHLAKFTTHDLNHSRQELTDPLLAPFLNCRGQLFLLRRTQEQV